MPAAKPILLATSLSQDESSETTPLRYTNCSHCISSPFPSTIFMSCLSLPIHCTSVFVLLTLKSNLLLVVWTLSTSCCRSLELPAAKQTSSAKRRLMPEVLAPTSLSSSANAITTLSRMLNSNDDNVHRCHFWDHHLITFGTFLDHFGTRNFKHVITLRDVYEAGQSIARLLLCRIGMF